MICPLRHAFALCNKKSLLDLPSFYDGCSAPFTVEHTLDCCVEGLIEQRHYEERDAVGDLASLAWGRVTREPVVCVSSTSPSGATPIADLQVCGIWQPQIDGVLFDICVVDTNACCYIDC